MVILKGVYPYEYMNSWERFNETSLQDKKAFYSELNLKDITHKDYVHAKKVWKVFEINNLGEYHHLYVQSDTLLLADNFGKLETRVLKYMDLIHLISYLHQD